VDLVLDEGGTDVLLVADNRQHRSHSHPPAPPQQPIMSVPGLAFAGAWSFPTTEAAVTGLAQRSAPDTPRLARERATVKDSIAWMPGLKLHTNRLGEPPPGPITTAAPIPVAASHMRRPAT